jgi:hypothetical protein
MERTLALIHGGKSEDVEPKNGWSAAEKAQAAKTTVYLVGGGMGASKLGEAIIAHALQELSALGLHHLSLIQVRNESAAPYAAALLALKTAKKERHQATGLGLRSSKPI